VLVPGNAAIDRTEIEERLRRYYEPYRRGVIEAVRRAIARYGTCLHLSVHSFAPEVGAVERRADIGLLYDPRRDAERTLARHLAARLGRHSLRPRLNYPYRGTSDGFTTHCRRLFSPERYLGLEIETNQRLLTGKKDVRSLALALATSLEGALRAQGAAP